MKAALNNFLSYSRNYLQATYAAQKITNYTPCFLIRKVKEVGAYSSEISFKNSGKIRVVNVSLIE
jgi:hypothetical protein